MRVLVTGGAGFIGVELVRQMLPWVSVREIVVLDAMCRTAAPQALPESDAIEVIEGRLSDEAVLTELVDSCDAVINLAGETFVDASIEDDREFVESNFVGTANVLRALRRTGGSRRRLLHASTDEVFGEAIRRPFRETSPYAPRNPYSATKAGADHMVRAYANTYGIDAVICHMGNLYGPWQYPEKLIPVTVARLLDGLPARVYGSGLQVRTFLHVTDAVDGLLRAFEHGSSGESYLIGAPDDHTTLEVVVRIAELMGVTRPIDYVADRPGGDVRYTLDTNKAEAELAWKPAIDFEHGLAQTVGWLTTNHRWWRR
ncbi:dTDP-glucose 4,6-dehydratase [Nocardia goodfellowii]